MNVPTYSKPIVSVSIVERHNYMTGGFKFFGTMNVDSGEGDDGIAQYDVECFRAAGFDDVARIDGEFVVRAILRDAIVQACDDFAARCDGQA